MNYNLEKIKPENYQRAFFFKKLGYLLTDLTFSYYKQRDFLAIYNNEMLGTYIGNSAADKTLINGKEIFSSKRNFKIFENGFREVITECEAFLKKSKKLESVKINDLFDLKAIINKTYYFFEKTEFFFTDACYYGEMNEMLKNNLLVLGDDLKMKSRPLFIEIMTSILYRFAELAAKQNSLNVEDVKFLSFDEVIHLMETGKRADSQVIHERQKSFVIYCEDGCLFPVTGEQKQTVLERFKEPDYKKITEFKGVVANKGKIVARARIILPEYEQEYESFVKKLHSMEMNNGEILVTETTSPDFVPLMKKAGGIIANQGGLNSHAAIMSRELGVPCLVGTYYATDILSTGDLIELDANSGVVRIIEKSTQ